MADSGDSKDSMDSIAPLRQHALVPVFAATFAVTFVAAFTSAVAAERFLVDRIPLIGTMAGLQLSHNPGIAFGVRIPSPWQELLIGGALCMVAFVAFRERTHRLTQAAFGMILAGAAANIIDRFSDGTVTDFFQVGAFPVFNVADSAITIGAALLLLDAVFIELRRRSALTKAEKQGW